MVARSKNLLTKVPHTRNPVTGLPAYSLYGNILKPSMKMLDDLDALVFDVQDVGARFYTDLTTLGYAMEAAAEKGMTFYVLDRPNPLTALRVQGSTMDREMRSFTGYFPLPIQQDLTVGELAEMLNAEKSNLTSSFKMGRIAPGVS
ncbi:MAG: exo-beta-N-acetylmuramidase NamZ domain-containing protein [Thermodesulfobacteriota bacterium]